MKEFFTLSLERALRFYFEYLCKVNKEFVHIKDLPVLFTGYRAYSMDKISSYTLPKVKGYVWNQSQGTRYYKTDTTHLYIKKFSQKNEIVPCNASEQEEPLKKHRAVKQKTQGYIVWSFEIYKRIKGKQVSKEDHIHNYLWCEKGQKREKTETHKFLCKNESIEKIVKELEKESVKEFLVEYQQEYTELSDTILY